MDNSDNKKDFNKALTQLRQSFVARLDHEYNEINRLLNSLIVNASNETEIESLRQIFHKLAGSGGTFGLSGLGANAKTAEQQLQNWQKHTKFKLSHDNIQSLFDIFNKVKRSQNTLDNATALQLNDLPKSIEEQTNNVLWLIEDDTILASELKRQLETFGFKTLVFDSLKKADIKAKSQQPNALVIDVMFDNTEINATESFQTFSHLSKLNCPLIFISAFDDFDSRIRAVQLNACGYFLKPVSIPEIVNHLRRIFQQVKVPDANILIIEDDIELAKYYQLVLQSAGFETDYLIETKQILNKLNTFNPEVILMDLNMPKYSGMDLAGVIRQHDRWMSLPIVYLSAETDVVLQSKALEKGADDFLTKPINDIQLVASVKARVIRSRQLDDMISRDSLTGLLKHAVIKNAVFQEVNRSKRNGNTVTVVMLDIDHFKKVNDTYGHGVGDVVISAISTVLQQRLRNTDLIGRYGGEEFVIILPDCNMAKAFEMLEEIRKSFYLIDFTHQQQIFHCSFSAGIIDTEHNPGLTGEEMLVAADKNLYHAKTHGRNKISCADKLT